MPTPTDPSFPQQPGNPGPADAIFLIGFMGAGKTSVGQALATTLGWRFVDLDARIVARTGRTVADIFGSEGEPRFRQMETDELRNLLAELGTTKTVISLGGGAWMQPANVTLLKTASLPVIHLDAPAEELWNRCLPEQGLRPLLQNEAEFHRLYHARIPAYRDGTLRIDTQGLSVQQVARQIGLLLGLAGMNPNDIGL